MLFYDDRKKKTRKKKFVTADKYINIRCTNQQKDMIKAAAQSQGVSATKWMMRICVRAAKNQLEKKQ